MIPVSVLILTLNEETNIRACMESCAWCDDVAVLDSGSTDATCEIARELGAKVHTHPFTSFGVQRNWAIDNVPMKHDWIFHLDADERFTPELVNEMRILLAGSPPEAGFFIPSKLMFMGHWLKRAGGYPTYQMRLFHKGRMRFRDYGHGQRELTDGTIGNLEQPYLHYNFSKGIDDWLDKHNRYSTAEARQIVASRAEPLRVGKLLSGDKVERQRAWKRIWYRLPMRPALRWFATLFMEGGILEGRPGWTYASLQGLYERMISRKVKLGGHALYSAGQDALELDSLQSANIRRKWGRRAALDANGSNGSANGMGDGGSEIQITGREQTLEEPNLFRQRYGADLDQGEKWPYPFHIYLRRLLWRIVYYTIWKLCWKRLSLRARLLRLFGARTSVHVNFAGSVWIEMPFDLTIGRAVIVGPGATLYNLGGLSIGDYTVISQDAYICGGTHDFTDPRFPLLRKRIKIGHHVWIAAGAFIGPGVTIGDGAVVGARAVVLKDVPPWTVVGGHPAKVIKPREMRPGQAAHLPT